jgi:hypothetical protein
MLVPRHPARTAFAIAVLLILAPLFILFIALPFLAVCAVLDFLGIIIKPGDWSDRAREEWLKWEAERQQREELQPVTDEAKAA